ncbi:MAG TPA: winged helix-turn-helix domain-containing protein [Nitrososphaerales archaeon]|nr:winged helix-turn-helix domain-containing protein [Nitrososphaerales archaeon]
MSKNGSGGSPGTDDDVLRGTTLRIYRFMYKEGRPMGLHEIQRALGLSSASIPQYHINKLISAGLVKEQESGGRYYVDRLVFENMIRIRRSLIPFQTTYTIFFCTTLIILLTLLRPGVLTSLFLFAVSINLAAILIFASQAYRTLRRRNSI